MSSKPEIMDVSVWRGMRTPVDLRILSRTAPIRFGLPICCTVFRASCFFWRCIYLAGSGGAGMFAALHAQQTAPTGTKITIAVKGLIGKCGCTRMVHKGDLTGIENINRVMEQVLSRPIETLQEHRAVGLIPTADGSALAGVLFINLRTGTFRFVRAKTVMMGTGGERAGDLVEVAPTAHYFMGGVIVDADIRKMGRCATRTKPCWLLKLNAPSSLCTKSPAMCRCCGMNCRKPYGTTWA